MKTFSDKIIQPLVSEKAAAREASLNEYAIVVDQGLSKTEIFTAVEKIFGVRPLSVRTVNFRKKEKKNRYSVVAPQSYKKALLRLPEGKKLEVK